MPRTLVGELMDDPAAPRDELDRALRYIRWVNRTFGGTRALLYHLETWSRRWPRDRAITLLDLGTGSADIPIAAVKWARRAGFDLRITAIDLHETTLDIARAQVAQHGMQDVISIERADALRLMDNHEPGSFDYVHAGMFLHHLSPIEVLTALRIMDRLARRGIVWNDLVRSSLSLAVVRLSTIGQPHMVRHDAIASIRAAFTKREVLDIARRVGITYATYRTWLVHRFTLAGEKRR